MADIVVSFVDRVVPMVADRTCGRRRHGSRVGTARSGWVGSARVRSAGDHPRRLAGTAERFPDAPPLPTIDSCVPISAASAPSRSRSSWSPVSSPRRQRPAADVSESAIQAAEQDALALTNKRRTARGLVKLRWDARMAALARDRAEYMAATGNFSHTQSGGRDVFDMIEAAGIRWYAAGEIIAWNTAGPLDYSASFAVQGWMGSAEPPGDRRLGRLQLRRFRAGDRRRRDPLLGGRLPPRPRPDGRLRPGRLLQQGLPQRDLGARHDPLERRRPPPAGPDRRAPLLPGPAASRRRVVGEPRDDPLDVRDQVVATRRALRVPGPRARPERQLGSLGDQDARRPDAHALDAHALTLTP